MTLLSLSKENWTVLIGNAYDHYDSALYGLMVPFLAPLFFPSFDPVVQLIMGYGFLCTSIVERPISVFIFSLLGEKNGEQWSPSFSLLGAGLFTLCIGFLPIYGQIGLWAPFGLCFIKFIRGFFLSGDRVVARFFFAEKLKKRSSLHSVFLLRVIDCFGHFNRFFFCVSDLSFRYVSQLMVPPFYHGAWYSLDGRIFERHEARLYPSHYEFDCAQKAHV